LKNKLIAPQTTLSFARGLFVKFKQKFITSGGWEIFLDETPPGVYNAVRYPASVSARRRILRQERPMTEQYSFPENDQPQVTNLSQVDVETVKAELVRMHQSTAQVINSEDVELSNGAALEVNAANVMARQAGFALVQADEITMQQSAAVAVRAEKISMNGYAGAVVSGSVEFGNARSGVVVSREVHSEKIETVILLSNKVEGNVTTVMDTRGALITGLAGGLFAGLILLLGCALFGKK